MMFAHHVIESLKQNKDNVLANTSGSHREKFFLYVAELLLTIERIKKAQHFYLGEQDELLDHGPGKNFIGKRMLFMDEKEQIRLPYPICTFSAHKLFDEVPEAHDQTGDELIAPSHRRFAVVEQINDETIKINLVAHLDSVEKVNNGFGWQMTPVVYFIRIGKFGNDEWLQQFIPKEYSQLIKQKNGNVFALPLVNGRKHNIQEDIGDLSMINLALLMLNCKNIVSEKIIAPAKLNKKRWANGKQAIFDYHVLNVELPKKKHGKYEWKESVGHNRVHLCRGHFKEYTPERPLFGHYVGMYWWQPHARGQNHDGIVMKDYRLTVAQPSMGDKMGAAKRRGAQEQRVAAAIDRDGIDKTTIQKNRHDRSLGMAGMAGRPLSALMGLAVGMAKRKTLGYRL